MEQTDFRKEQTIIAIVVILVLLGAVLITYWACNGNTYVVGCVRDIAIIALVVETMVVTVLLLVMTVLMTELTRLIRDRLLPVLESSIKTMKTVEGTTTFVSDTIAAPIIRLASFGSFVRGTFAAIFRRRKRQSKPQAEDQQ